MYLLHLDVEIIILNRTAGNQNLTLQCHQSVKIMKQDRQYLVDGDNI